jgi:hypothetical protein
MLMSVIHKRQYTSGLAHKDGGFALQGCYETKDIEHLGRFAPESCKCGPHKPPRHYSSPSTGRDISALEYSQEDIFEEKRWVGVGLDFGILGQFWRCFRRCFWLEYLWATLGASIHAVAVIE